MSQEVPQPSEQPAAVKGSADPKPGGSEPSER